MFRDEEGYPDNGQRANLVFMGYPYTPPLPRDDYAGVVKDLQAELPVRFWYFLDEVTTAELMRKVWRAILRSDVSVFDISEGNPNVAFELGLAVAKDRRCITLLKTGAKNLLGSSDLGYSERMEYASAATLRDKLKDFVMARSTAMRKLDEMSYRLVPADGSHTREQVLSNLTALVTRIFNTKSVTKSGATTLMKSEALAVAALSALRAEDVSKSKASSEGPSTSSLMTGFIMTTR